MATSDQSRSHPPMFGIIIAVPMGLVIWACAALMFFR
jgi:hypothetical protein